MRQRVRLSTEATYFPPKVYRYLGSKFVDSLFSKGELFLTSYQRCRAHEDSVRKDSREGKYNLHFQGNQQSLHLVRQSGDCSYMLCTSLSKEPRLLQHFSVDSYFEIIDVENFMQEVARSLPKVIDMHAKPAVYVWHRHARRTFDDSEFLPDTGRILATIQENGHKELDRVWKEVHEEHAERLDALISDISFYAKPIAYVAEMEYRIVWTTSEPAEGGIVVHCPNAVRYCRRVDA